MDPRLLYVFDDQTLFDYILFLIIININLLVYKVDNNNRGSFLRQSQNDINQ